MKYEIINPSDECYIYADEPKIAAACIAIMAEGAYGCKGEDGSSLPTMFIFGGDPDATWKEYFGITISDYLKQPGVWALMAACFESFEYPHERSSLNNIGACAASMAKRCRKLASKS